MFYLLSLFFREVVGHVPHDLRYHVNNTNDLRAKNVIIIIISLCMSNRSYRPQQRFATFIQLI